MGDSEDDIETDDMWLDDFQGEEEFAWKENGMLGAILFVLSYVGLFYVCVTCKE
jgi:hypothetical protein